MAQIARNLWYTYTQLHLLPLQWEHILPLQAWWIGLYLPVVFHYQGQENSCENKYTNVEEDPKVKEIIGTVPISWNHEFLKEKHKKPLQIEKIRILWVI